MKIRNTHPRFGRKKYWVIAAALILIGVSFISFYLYQNRQNSDSLYAPIDYSLPTEEQADAGNTTKEKAIERGTPNNSASPNIPEADVVSMDSTFKRDSQQLIITTKLANSFSWDKCELDVSQGSNVKSFEARTVYQPDSSFCGGFTVPTQGMSGIWEVRLTATDLNGKNYEERSNVTLN